MTLSSDSMAELNLDDQQPGHEMAPWITFTSIGATGIVAIAEQSPYLGAAALAVGIINLVYEKVNRQRAANQEIVKLKEQMSVVNNKLDMILLVDSRRGLPRVPRGDGGDGDS